MSYLETLKHPVIARLSLIQFISYFGTWFSQVAIFSMIVAYGADAMTIAMTAAISMLPAVIMAPVIGLIIDSIEFKKLMMILLIVEVAMTIGFVFIDSLEYIWVLMILMFMRSFAASILFSAEMALFPKLVDGEMLKNTNEIHSIIWSICYASGMAMGGLATYYLGYDMAFVMDAALYTVAIILLMGLKISLEPVAHRGSAWQMFVDGIRYIKSHKKIVHLILMHSAVGLTSFDALITLLADMRYKELIAVPLAIGSMNAIRAIGLSVGPFLISRYVTKDTLHYFFIIQGASIMLWATQEHHFYMSLATLLVSGLFITTLWSYTYLMVQEETDRAYMGRVISYNDMIFMLSNAITAIFIGYASQQGVSLEWITICLGAGFMLFAVYYAWFRRRYIL